MLAASVNGAVPTTTRALSIPVVPPSASSVMSLGMQFEPRPAHGSTVGVGVLDGVRLGVGVSVTVGVSETPVPVQVIVASFVEVLMLAAAELIVVVPK